MMHTKIQTEIPGPKSRELMARRSQAVPRGPFHVAPIFVAKTQGSVVTDVDGNKFLDFVSGIGVTNLGHCHPEIISAIHQQADQFLHTAFNVTPYESYIQLAELLNKATPGNFPKKTFLANSGAEAVENAIKIARAYTKRQAVVCFDHAFHGRTFFAMGLTAKAKPYREGFAPFPSEIYRAPFPYAYRWLTENDEERVSQECYEQFEDLVKNKIALSQVAAVIIEPVTGEGGFIPAPKKFLKLLSEFCATHKIITIADEIQTGFGRTGTLFASEQLEFIPDLVTSAKGLGGGMPISAITGRSEIMDAPEIGGIGGTFGGNPLSCAAALASFKIFSQPETLQRAKEVGKFLNQKLQLLAEKNKCIGDVRGLGPMQALEIVKDRSTKEPNPELTKKIVQKSIERGLIIMSSGTYSNVIRFLLPINISTDELDEGLEILEQVLEQCAE